MSSKKRRAEFNKQWRKDRKILKKAYRFGPDFNIGEVISLAAKYNIDFPRERVK